MTSSIRIGGVDFSLSYDGELLKSHQTLGIVNHNSGEIMVDATLPDQRKVIEVLHECIHAMINCARLSGVFKCEDDEERFVSVMAHQFASFIRDNVELLRKWNELWAKSG